LRAPSLNGEAAAEEAGSGLPNRAKGSVRHPVQAVEVEGR